MRPPAYMRSVVDRNVGMRRIIADSNVYNGTIKQAHSRYGTNAGHLCLLTCTKLYNQLHGSQSVWRN